MMFVTDLIKRSIKSNIYKIASNNQIDNKILFYYT